MSSGLDIYGVFLAGCLRGAVNRVLRALRPPPASAPTRPPDPDADRWGEAAVNNNEGPSLGWLDAKWVVDEYVYPRVFGDARHDTWGENAVAAFGIPANGSWLSIGCGGGNIELQMAERGLFKHMISVDASPGAIAVARREAQKRGVSNVDFRVVDSNTWRLPRNTFDVVHMNMSLHHVESLEKLVSQINESLRPGGVFIANEFVGPNQFQHSEPRLNAVRDALAAIPEPLRWNPIAREVKTEWRGFDRSFWNEWDPTESIRSDEIPGILLRNFPKLVRRDYGGSILNLALENIVQNFDMQDEAHRKYAHQLLDLETSLLEAGVFTSDFAYFVCPKGDAVARLRGRIAAVFDLRRRVTVAVRRHAWEQPLRPGESRWYRRPR